MPDKIGSNLPIRQAAGTQRAEVNANASQASGPVSRPASTTPLASLGKTSKSLAPRAVQVTPQRVDANYRQAEERVNDFFSPRPAAQHAKDMQEATADIEHYLSTHPRGAEVPPELKSFMIDVRAMTPHIARAAPFGDGNILVRTEHEDGSLHIDDKKTFEKSNLKFLGEKTQEKVEEGVRRERDLQKSARVMASGMLVGVISCNHRAELLAVSVHAHLAEHPELKDRVKVSFLSTPNMEGKTDGRVDHRYVKLAFTDDSGKEHELACDAWSADKVALADDSKLSNGFSSSAAHLASGLPGMKDLVLAHMNKANEEMPAVAASKAYRDQAEGNRTGVLAKVDPHQRYTLGNTLDGWVDSPARTAKDDLPARPVRRNTLVDAENSPLLSED